MTAMAHTRSNSCITLGGIIFHAVTSVYTNSPVARIADDNLIISIVWETTVCVEHIQCCMRCIT